MGKEAAKSFFIYFRFQLETFNKKKDLRKNYESAFAGLVEKIELGFLKSFSLRGFGNPGSNTEEFNVFPVPNNVHDLKIGNGR